MEEHVTEQYCVDSDIRQSPEFIALLADDTFCKELWSAFANITWVKMWDRNKSNAEQIFDVLSSDYESRQWGASFRSMGGVIADLRNDFHDTNENYMDWYCSGPYGEVSERVREELAKLGWTPVEDEHYLDANSLSGS